MITINTKAFNFDSAPAANIAQYTGPAHTFSKKDVLVLKRTAPKPTKDSDGVAKSESKFTRTVTLANGKIAEALITTGVSFPVGMADADILALRDDMSKFVISANGDALYRQHDINQ
jgi:hypothetical protein